jgi:hypothetical protein
MRKLSRPKLIVRGPEQADESCHVNVPEPVTPVTICHVNVQEPVSSVTSCSVTVQEPVKTANLQNSNSQICNSVVRVIDPQEPVGSSDALATDTYRSSGLEKQNKEVRSYFNTSVVLNVVCWSNQKILVNSSEL